MIRHKLLNIVFSVLVITTLVFGGTFQAFAQGSNPIYLPMLSADSSSSVKAPLAPSSSKYPHQKKGRITMKDRKAAAKNAAAAGLQVGVAAAGTTAPLPGGIPDYFGPFPNWAFSPLPTGSILTITVDAPGSGYTAPVVNISDAYGNGTGASANAVLNGNGGIAGFTNFVAGSGYVAPVVTISETVPAGSGAAASAVLGNITGGLKKFVNPLPSLVIASADTTTYPGADFYEIHLREYSQVLASGLPATKLRGYVQVQNGADVAPISYLGPVIAAQKDRPVRIKFVNELPTGQNGNLFIPVDTTYMGAGANGSMTTDCSVTPKPANCYTENRATLHLHGGNTPWISDGTPHQWITPAGENTNYPKGVSVQYVPDMDGGTEPAGTMTFYYTNQQSARLLFYHDHAYGITRLNVYAGEAAGYLITDPTEQGLISNGVIPGTIGVNEFPLVIQDKTFVDANTIGKTDPTWKWGSAPGTPNTGDLWFPHVYIPNQNPYDISGANAIGRWDYGPWFWPPYSNLQYLAVPNPYCLPTAPLPGSTEANPGNYDCSATPWEPPFIPGTPPNPTVPEATNSPSGVPEGFMDTPVVNGMAYPTLNVPAGLVRFRILNAANDRYFNLSLWVAASKNAPTTPGTTGTVLCDGVNAVATPDCTEVKMVPFNSSQNLIAPFPTWWYTVGSPHTLDDRVGGVPDPATRGPAMIQIANESGFLPAPAVIKNQPVNYDYNLRSITVLNVLEHALWLGPAERADVLVDFTNFAGKTLIVYNDSPAPVPAGDPRNDYYTGDPDQTSMGGAPTTQPGLGPNTRTIMQIVVGGSGGTGPVDDYNPATLANLKTAIPAAFAAGQPMPLVPNSAYNAAYNSTTLPADQYVRIQETSKTLLNGLYGLEGVTLGIKGAGYTGAPVVTIDPPSLASGTTATAAVTLAPTTLASITLNSGGSGYTAPPAVSFTGGGGSGATATSTLAPTSIASVAVTAGGKSYTSATTVTIAAPAGCINNCVQATATATVVNGAITAVNVVNHGAGYTTIPGVTFSGKGSGAAARANLQPTSVAGVTLGNPGSGYTSAPNVVFTGSYTSQATATANLTPTSVGGITLTNPGSGYTTAPQVTIAAPTSGVQATATSSISVLMPLQPKAIQELFTLDFGRMNATLGVEIPSTNGQNQTTIPYGYIDPPTEITTKTDGMAPIGTAKDGTQLWKITHNGVDTHVIHFHLFDVQVINRVGWDGAVKPPDANELGWKDTVRMNPLEDVIVALRPMGQKLPWDLPNSYRLLDVTMPAGSTMGFTNVDPTGQPATVVNALVNFGDEYVWHCHILGHEENDMMRAQVFAVAPIAPSNLTATVNKGAVVLTWIDNSKNETSFTVQRTTVAGGLYSTIATLQSPSNTTGPSVSTLFTYTDTNVKKGTTYYYQVIANNTVGDTQVFAAPAVGYPNLTVSSAPANGASAKP